MVINVQTSPFGLSFRTLPSLLTGLTQEQIQQLQMITPEQIAQLRMLTPEQIDMLRNLDAEQIMLLMQLDANQVSVRGTDLSTKMIGANFSRQKHLKMHGIEKSTINIKNGDF